MDLCKQGKCKSITSVILSLTDSIYKKTILPLNLAWRYL